MKKNTKMFQRSLTAFLTAALVTTSFGGQGIVFAKAKKKASELTEDEVKDGEKKIQNLTDKYCSSVDQLVSEKEKEIMSI